MNGALKQYAAGFFDGEGSVGVDIHYYKNGRLPYFVVNASVTNTVRAPLLVFKKLWGGKVISWKPAKPHHKTPYRWTVGARKAERFLVDLLPYLRVRHRVAKWGLRLIRTHGKGDRGKSDAYMARLKHQRTALFLRIRALNKKGAHMTELK